MPRDYAPGSSRPIPILDNGERERLRFWGRHAAPIQSDLLEITGWLSEAPDRELLTRSPVGRIEVATAGSHPANVLFLVPKEGTRAYQSWDWALGYLRVEQNRRRLVKQQQTAAEAELSHANDSITDIKERFRTVETRLRELAQRARRGVERGSRPSVQGPLTRLKSGLAEARALKEEFRVAERHRDTIKLRLEGLRDHLVPRVYPGLWARINSFLDLQALSVANVASEEFRKFPRPMERLARALEHELETD